MKTIAIILACSVVYLMVAVGIGTYLRAHNPEDNA